MANIFRNFQNALLCRFSVMSRGTWSRGHIEKIFFFHQRGSFDIPIEWTFHADSESQGVKMKSSGDI